VLAPSLRGDGGGATTTGEGGAPLTGPPFSGARCKTPSLPPAAFNRTERTASVRASGRARFASFLEPPAPKIGNPTMTKDAEQKRKRYADDAEYRENKLKSGSAYRKANRAKINAHRRQKYATDSEFRAKKLADNAKRQRKRICKAHGISVEEYETMLARQRGACGICERPFRRTPCIDHCHKTRMVRGLLCGKCNVGLGYYDDNPAFLRKAADYIERFLQRLPALHDREENGMTPNDDPAEESKAAGLVRKAILLELHQPCGVDLPPPVAAGRRPRARGQGRGRA
jgi:hypothetical protein